MSECKFGEWLRESDLLKRSGSDPLAHDSMARMLWVEMVEPQQKKIKELEKILSEAVVIEGDLFDNYSFSQQEKIDELEKRLAEAVELIKYCSKPELSCDKMIACDNFLNSLEEKEGEE